MRPFIILAALAAFAIPAGALAADPSETSQHTGKSVDGKTNGMPEESAEKIGQQQKEPAKLQTDQSKAEPAKAGTADADGKKSP
jgi:hypothetical protein